MKIRMRIPQGIYWQIHTDLDRQHDFAYERVGFMACGATRLSDGGILLLAESYYPVADGAYLPSDDVRPMIGPDSNTAALHLAYTRNISMFHVHRHEMVGVPRFSRVDLKTNDRLIPDFFKVRATMPHGAIVFSQDAMYGVCWLTATERSPISECVVVGNQSPGVRAIV